MKIQLANPTKIAITAAACLLGLVVTLLSCDVILYIFIYSLWGILYPMQVKESQNSIWYRPIFWIGLIVLMTVGIILVYAL
jgi:hypothetical protein